MNPTINGQTSHHSGDINLVAALMSQGISLDRECPVSIVETDGGSYGSYRFKEISDDGTLATDDLTGHWIGRGTLPKDHGFVKVCEFIKARPKGLQSTDGLLDFAIGYLAERGHIMPGLKGFSDIPRFVSALPQSEASYVLAYIWNRQILFDLHKSATRKIYMTEGAGNDQRRALIDSKLPKHQRNELLSRLQG